LTGEIGEKEAIRKKNEGQDPRKSG